MKFLLYKISKFNGSVIGGESVLYEWMSLSLDLPEYPSWNRDTQKGSSKHKAVY